MALIELSASVIDSGSRPGGQLLQPSGQLFELLVCTEFVQAVNADLNRLGVAVGDTVDVFDVTHDRLRSNETGIRERPDVLRNATPVPNKATGNAGGGSIAPPQRRAACQAPKREPRPSVPSKGTCPTLI